MSCRVQQSWKRSKGQSNEENLPSNGFVKHDDVDVEHKPFYPALDHEFLLVTLWSDPINAIPPSFVLASHRTQQQPPLLFLLSHHIPLWLPSSQASPHFIGMQISGDAPVHQPPATLMAVSSRPRRLAFPRDSFLLIPKVDYLPSITSSPHLISSRPNTNADADAEAAAHSRRTVSSRVPAAMH